jgi:SAM-dependent methyltransferase
VSASRGYELEAENWIAWARTPEHDIYWDFSGPSFVAFLPDPGRLTLDLGCGEGRLARDLKARGHRVIAIDASPTLVRHAQEADPEGDYRVADAAALPFQDGEFDLVVALNSLQDVDDLPGAARESARVLEPGGRLCICTGHPFKDAGAFESEEADARFVISGSYFGRRPYDETFEREGLTMRFRGWSYPLEGFTRALEDAGFLIEALLEPVPDLARFPRRASMARWLRVPMFLFIRAVRG